MGLDMYLYASKSLSGYTFDSAERKTEYNNLIRGLGVEKQTDPDSPYAQIRVTVGYWRKANAIHGWFHRNCGEPDNDVSFYVGRDNLLKLKHDCAVELLKGRAMPKHEAVRSIQVGKVGEDADVMTLIKDMIEVESHSHEFNDESNTDPLRPVAGFFFGSTEKDDWYYDNLKETISIVDRALTLDDNWRFGYEASY